MMTIVLVISVQFMIVGMLTAMQLSVEAITSGVMLSVRTIRNHRRTSRARVKGQMGSGWFDTQLANPRSLITGLMCRVDGSLT